MSSISPYPLNVTDATKQLASLIKERLTPAEREQLTRLIADSYHPTEPDGLDPVAPSEFYTDAQLAGDATAIAAGEDFAAALVLAGWTAPE